MTASDADRLLTRREVAERFGITKRYLEIAATQGTGPPMVKMGRLVRYRASDINRWIDRLTLQQHD